MTLRWPWTADGPAKDESCPHTARIETLERHVKNLRAEWEDMYEKLVRRDARIRKREERSEAAEQGQESIPLVLDRKAALRARLRAGGAS